MNQQNTVPAKFGLDHRIHFRSTRAGTVTGEWERIDAEAVVSQLLDSPGEDNLAELVADIVRQVAQVAYCQGIRDASKVQQLACRELEVGKGISS
jgi:hypothetical protein